MSVAKAETEIRKVDRNTGEDIPMSNEELTIYQPEDYQYEELIQMAEQADKIAEAMNKIANAALKVTTEFDWVLIAGKPYLQESGATKVATLFNISWKIGDVKKSMDQGYPAYHYKIILQRGQQTIEAEGSRSGRDKFFGGVSPDEIDEGNVRKSAFTNALNNGIKRIIPGLRNIDVTTLSNAGLDTSRINGYTFKEGKKGGKGKSAEKSGITCADCNAAITQNVASFSESKYGRRLCMGCQKKSNNAPPAAKTATPKQLDLAEQGMFPTEAPPANY